MVVRNKVAEIFDKHLSKGDKVYIEGKIKTRSWQDKDQKDRLTTEVNVDDFTFLSTKKSELARSNLESSAPPAAEENSNESDLPF